MEERHPQHTARRWCQVNTNVTILLLTLLLDQQNHEGGFIVVTACQNTKSTEF